MKLLFSILLIALAAGVASGQDIAPVDTPSIMKSVSEVIEPGGVTAGDVALTPFGDDSVRPVVKGSGHLTQRIILVLDVSGSMRSENRIGRVLQVVRHVMEQPADDLEVAVIAFSSWQERWPGVPEPEAKPPVPFGWARLPSATALESARGWVATRRSGGTEPNDALKAAIMEAREKTSVVFVTDGDFDGDSCVEAFRNAQKDREAAGFGKAPVLVYGVGTGASEHKHLATIGKEGGVGFWVDKGSGKPDVKKAPPRSYR